MGDPDIALGIVCKAPVDGACKTRLCPPLTTREAAALSRCFIADVAAAVDAVAPRSGFAVYTPQDAQAAFDGLLPPGFPMLVQRGDGLDERLVHATDDLLSAGFGGVCLINADSPTLPPALLQQAVHALRQPGDRIVLGPAIDGGYWLIGLKRPHVALFEGVVWSTSQVLAQTLARVAALGVPLSLLPLWYDVDDLGSLQLLLQELFGNGVPLALDGRAGAPAPHSRHYLWQLLQAADSSRFGFPLSTG